ncbi:unnamed protein product [Prunus armeniaca]
MVFVLLEKFRAVEGQENTLEGDVLSQETFECKLAEVEETPKQQISADRTGRTATNMVAKQMCFSKPTKELANHLRPLFITANFGGIPIPKVMVDGGAAVNLLPYRLLIKMGRTEKDLIPTRLTVTNFSRGITKTHGILDVDVKTPLLPLTMHCLAEIESSRVYVFLPLYTSSWPSSMKRAIYYHDDLSLFTFFGVNQNGRTHGVTAQKLIEEGLASSLEGWNRPCILNLQSSDV